MDTTEITSNNLPPCPDCGASWAPAPAHTRTCPLARALRAVVWADTYWFKRMPWMSWRTRPVAAAELAEMHWMGVEPPPGAVMRVIRLAPGLHRRTLVAQLAGTTEDQDAA